MKTMTDFANKLDDQDLAKLHARFVVPIVVDNMLRDEEPLDDVAEHAMNEILTELRPDTALLCIAMCAQHIARHTADLPIAGALAAEAGKIVNEYAPVWIANEQNSEAVDEGAILDMLVYIPEDLEALRDLLEATMGALEEDHCIAAILCDIFSLQADMHKDLAEVELLNINLQPQQRTQSGQGERELALGDNVILFPSAARVRTRSRPF